MLLVSTGLVSTGLVSTGLASTGLVSTGLTPTVLAHAFGERYELPIPLVLFVLGGALVVLASFALIAKRSVAPETAAPPEDGTHLRRLRPTGAAGSLVGLGLLIAAGLFGSQELAENILPTIFWVLIWVAVPLSCGVLGDWTQAVNPFANVAKLMSGPAVRKAILGTETPLGWPRRAGWWPAVALYFLLASGELIYNQFATLPRVIAGGLAVYLVISAFFGLLFGPAWLERGEVFTVLFATWGRLGYFRFGAPGRRRFAGGLEVPFGAGPSRLVFVLLLLVSVNFDGLIATPTWARWQRHLPDAIRPGTHALQWATTGAFLALVGILALLFGAFAVGAARAGGQRLTGRFALAGLLPSLLPIAFGYLLSHYVEYLAVNLQLLLPLLGNPVGKEGWPIHLPYPFNDTYEVNLHILPSAFYWYAAVVVIVAVHIVAVLLAHQRLNRATTDHQLARRSEYPWLAAMVGYTMLSLWLMAQPLTKA